MRKTFITLAMVIGLALSTMATVAAAEPTATITGSVGENVSTTDGYDGRHLRYVGDPAPDGYASWYQWGSPHVLTQSPEEVAVTMAGALDVAAMSEDGQVAVIGLHDADALRAGDRGEKAEVGIYVTYRMTNGSVTYDVGVTDGDAGGGEFVQSFTTFDAADLTNGILDVEFVVDGALDPASCASHAADVATADGCMTLTVNERTVTDSYGTIVPTDVVIETELANGAHPGWYSAYTSEGPEVGVSFDLTISPIVLNEPGSVDDCKHGGFASFDFKNQGRCIASVKANARAGR